MSEFDPGGIPRGIPHLDKLIFFISKLNGAYAPLSPHLVPEDFHGRNRPEESHWKKGLLIFDEAFLIKQN